MVKREIKFWFEKVKHKVRRKIFELMTKFWDWIRKKAEVLIKHCEKKSEEWINKLMDEVM